MSFWRKLLPLAVAVVAPMSPAAAAQPTPLKADAFLARYCVACHGGAMQKAGRRFDDLPLRAGADLRIAERWEQILHQIQLGQMPPAKMPQPSAQERQALTAWIENLLTDARQAAIPGNGRVVHRRLNRLEYLNTIRDLFGFREGDFDPTTAFPADEEVDGLRNIGSALRVSRHHVEQYMSAADQVLAYAYDVAGVNGIPKPGSWADTPETLRSGLMAYGTGVVKAEKANGPAYIHLSHGIRNLEQNYDAKLFLDALPQGVPHSGWYDIEIEATAANRHHPYGKELMMPLTMRYYPDLKSFYDESQPMRLGVGRQKATRQSEWKRVAPNLVHAVDLPDERYETVRARVWLDQGAAPYLAFVNGPPKGTKPQFVSTKLDRFDPTVPKIDRKVWENLTLRAERDEHYYHLYKGPEIRIRRWQVTGPMAGTTKHAAQSLLFSSVAPDENKVSDAKLSAALAQLASTLFRRRTSAQDVAPYVVAVRQRLDGKTRYAEAARPVLKALLCAPEFLFHTERATAAGTLSGEEFVNRLSYFLTGGPPDSTLRGLAVRGPLGGAALRAQTDRLLDSPNADRFFSMFAAQWLGLNQLGTMPPGQEEFPGYYIDRLEPAMREETWRFVAELMRSRRPVNDLVNADFAYVNEALNRRVYGWTGAKGDDVERVTLPGHVPRLGLLRQASVLTVTANGVETSPVKRGVWLLDKIFGTPPSPPPPDVPPLEPDIRGAATVRQLLAKHRANATCAECHQKIDPLGFALEGYDPMGRPRENYPSGAKIDTTGEYRGHGVASAVEVRDYLLAHPELLANNLATRLTTYALGRSLSLDDRAAVRQLVAVWRSKGYALRELVHLITSGEPFRRP